MTYLIVFRRLQFLALLCLLLCQSCTVQYIADYDEITDRALMDLQRNFSRFFIQLEDKIGTPLAAYDLHKTFYQEAKVDISALHTRVDALPQNKFTTMSVGLLLENLELLESLHQEGIENIEVVRLVQQDFNRNLVNILRLELAKKRGDP